MATKGRPTGSRDRLRNNFFTALADDFDANGIAAIQTMREKDPSGYVRTVATLMPKDFEVTLHDRSERELSADELRDRIAAIEREEAALRGATSTGGSADISPRVH